jgi:hypothetical protein
METRAEGTPTSPCQVVVTERHPSGGDLYTVKIEMAPPASRVTHTYNARTGTVRHVFDYPRSEAAKLDTYQVRLTSRQSLTKDAITLPEPLVVPLPRR